MNYLMNSKAKSIHHLLYSSFQMLGEKEINKILFSRFKFTFLYHLLLLFSACYITYNFRAGLSWIILIALIFFLYLYSFLFHVKKRAQLIWLVYSKITHQYSTLEDSKEIIRQQKWPLRLFALFEIKLALSSKESEEKSGVIARFFSTALFSLEGMYKIAEDFLLPAIIIERLPLTQAVGKLKQLTQNVPATLAGVFGLDIFSGIIYSIINFIYGSIIISGVIFFWFLPQVLNGKPITLFPIIQSPENIKLMYFSLFVGVIILSLIRESLKVFITTIKAIYFSLFYTSINREHEITPEMKEEVTLYLTSINNISKIKL